MMKVLTSHDIRMIRKVLVDAGMVCHVNTGCNNDVRLDIVCARDMKWGNARGILDTACFLIRNVCDDVKIGFLSGADVGNDLHLSLSVGY